MNSIHFEAGMSSLCVCLIVRLLCIDKSIASLFFYTYFVSMQEVVSILNSLQPRHYLLKTPFW